MSCTDIGYDRGMGRWQPNSRGRLEQAALELYSERGFEQTTVAEIAKRAGLTERTFFRHFADKREVLFPDASPLETLLVDALAEVPADAAPMDAVAAALEAVAGMLGDRRELSRKRQSVISANPELQERELVKLASMSAALAGVLRRRGAGELAATLAAESGVAVFKVAFARWIAASEIRGLWPLVREALDELRAVTAGV
jgi:AcrR family transcriptional regulator